MNIFNFIKISLIVLIVSCNNNTKNLAHVGPTEIVNKDTIFHKIPNYPFVDQYNNQVFTDDFLGKISVVNFFFTTCPSICPKMNNNMIKIQKYFDLNKINLISYTVNPEYDNAETLNDYASKINAKSNWFFLTGKKENIYSIAKSGYFISVKEDKFAPGGFLHSEYFILVDKNGNIRSSFDKYGNVKGVYDGTNDREVSQLIIDIKTLIKE